TFLQDSQGGGRAAFHWKVVLKGAIARGCHSLQATAWRVLEESVVATTEILRCAQNDSFHLADPFLTSLLVKGKSRPDLGVLIRERFHSCNDLECARPM